jgi:hypothetical protein
MRGSSVSIQRADGNGRIRLGAKFANTKVVVVKIGKAEVRILVVADIPERELWLYENPQAISSLLRGLEQARNGEFSKRPPKLVKTTDGRTAKGKNSAVTKRAGR